MFYLYIIYINLLLFINNVAFVAYFLHDAPRATLAACIARLCIYVTPVINPHFWHFSGNKDTTLIYKEFRRKQAGNKRKHQLHQRLTFAPCLRLHCTALALAGRALSMLAMQAARAQPTLRRRA